MFTSLAQSFDSSKFSFVIGVSHTQAFEVNNGVLLSKPHSPVTAHLISKLRASLEADRKRVQAAQSKEAQMIQMMSMIDPAKAAQLKHESKGYQLNVIRVSGPGFVTKNLEQFLDEAQQAGDLNCDTENRLEKGPLVLPTHYFYPVSNAERGDQLTVDNYLDKVPSQVRP